MKKIIISLLALFTIAVQAQTFPVNNLTAAGYITAVGNITTSGGQFIGAGTGLTGTAAGLTAGSATTASSAITATTASNLAAGGAGQLVCQTATGTTGYVALGTNGYFLQAQTSGCPIWVAGSAYTPGSVAITGGSITGTTISGSTGAFTTLSASSTVSGAGFSTYLASPPGIGTTTPAAGVFLGATNGANPCTGCVGQYVATNFVIITIPTNTATNVGSISLPAGEYLVWGVVGIGNTGVTAVQAGISTTSATFGAFGTYVSFSTPSTTGTQAIATPSVRVTISTTTTVYLVGQNTCVSSGSGSQGTIYYIRTN